MSQGVENPFFARVFHRYLGRDRGRGEADLRRELLASVTGRVVEVGAGNGINFEHYPAGVEELIAVEPEPYLRGQAERAAAGAPVPVSVVPGRRSPFSTSLRTRWTRWSSPGCSAPFRIRARRSPSSAGSCVPGVSCASTSTCWSRRPGFARWQRSARPLWSRLMGGCRDGPRHARGDRGRRLSGRAVPWVRLPGRGADVSGAAPGARGRAGAVGLRRRDAPALRRRAPGRRRCGARRRVRPWHRRCGDRPRGRERRRHRPDAGDARVARERCGARDGLDNTRFNVGDVTALPYADGEFSTRRLPLRAAPRRRSAGRGRGDGQGLRARRPGGGRRLFHSPARASAQRSTPCSSRDASRSRRARRR